MCGGAREKWVEGMGYIEYSYIYDMALVLATQGEGKGNYGREIAIGARMEDVIRNERGDLEVCRELGSPDEKTTRIMCGGFERMGWEGERGGEERRCWVCGGAREKLKAMGYG